MKDLLSDLVGFVVVPLWLGGPVFVAGGLIAAGAGIGIFFVMALMGAFR